MVLARVVCITTTRYTFNHPRVDSQGDQGAGKRWILATKFTSQPLQSTFSQPGVSPHGHSGQTQHFKPVLEVPIWPAKWEMNMHARSCEKHNMAPVKLARRLWLLCQHSRTASQDPPGTPTPSKYTPLDPRPPIYPHTICH